MQKLQNELKATEFSLDRMLARMRTQKAKVFESVVIPSDPVKEQSRIYKLLQVKPVKEHLRKDAAKM